MTTAADTAEIQSLIAFLVLVWWAERHRALHPQGRGGGRRSHVYVQALGRRIVPPPLACRHAGTTVTPCRDGAFSTKVTSSTAAALAQ